MAVRLLHHMLSGPCVLLDVLSGEFVEKIVSATSRSLPSTTVF